MGLRRWVDPWVRNRLFRKYVVPFVAVVSWALLTNGLLEIYFTYQESRVALGQIQREKANAAAIRIEQFVREIERQMGWTTQPQVVAPAAALEQRKIEYIRLQRQVLAITEVAYIDGEGREQLRMSRLAMDVMASGADVSQEPRFRETRGGRVWYGPVTFRKESEPYMTLAVPHGSSAKAAVTTVEVNLKFIWDVVSQIKIGKLGQAYVVDRDGHLIAHPDIGLVLRKTDFSTQPHVQAARADLASPADRVDDAILGTDLSGRSTLVAHTVIAPLGWIVFVEQPIAEAFAPLRGAILRTGLLMLLGVLVSVAASLALARKISRPIQALQVGAARIGGGELGHRIDVRTKDELQELGEQFNRMAGALQESYATLEQKVVDRTRALTESLEQQTATAEILSVISSSPRDIQPVFETILANATRLCGAHWGALHLHNTGAYETVAELGATPALSAFRRQGPRHPGPDSVLGRVATQRRPIQVPELASGRAYEERDPERMAAVELGGARAILAVPMLKDNDFIGAITILRPEPGAFTDTQVALLETFADQAVIAIENVRLFKELETQNAALTESLDQQTATAEILKVISSSPTDVQPVLETVADNARRICGANDALIMRVEGAVMRRVAHVGALPPNQAEVRPITPGSVGGRAILEGRPIHVADIADAEAVREYPDSGGRRLGARTITAVPLLREGVALGVIIIRRTEVQPFTAKQLALLETFADQAVIAIENVRLFKELEARNAALTESLDQQTATSDILGVISSSPTDVKPVFDTIVQSAVRLLNGHSANVLQIVGDELHLAAMTSVSEAADAATRATFPMALTMAGVATHVIQIRRPYIVADIETDRLVGPRLRTTAPLRGFRSMLLVPMVRHEHPIGIISVTRPSAGAFSEDEVALLKTFADQAVIAIENVRLFKELEARNAALTESLDQQTATSDILGVISSSPTDVAPVFSTILASATRLCDASFAVLFLYDGEALRVAAHQNASPKLIRHFESGTRVTPSMEGPARRAAFLRETVHMADMTKEPGLVPIVLREENVRTVLAVPLLREGALAGVIAMWRREVRPFSDKQIALVRTFADQAVIAIENVRLFKELETRNAALTESLDQQTATSEILRVISSSPTDVQPVLDAVAVSAARLCGADDALIMRVDGDMMHRVAHYGAIASASVARPVTPNTPSGRAILERRTIHVDDILASLAAGEYPEARALHEATGFRTVLVVPLVREHDVVGVITVRRLEALPFTDKQIALLQTFADQAVIAIENVRLFNEIQDKTRQLEAANRHKDEFLASMSHELRTPLNAVIGFSEVLLEKMFGEVNAKQEEYLNDILASGRHLLSLINDILDLAKIEAGRMELDVEAFDVAQAVDNAVVLVRERATRKGLTLMTTLDKNLGEIRGDQRKIKQVMLNLLSNAVKFTPEGGQIEVRAQRMPDHVEIAVVDTGIGIAPEDLEAVFEEFRQVGTDYAKKHEGTGLGLTLSRKFVELHGGRIWVKSQLGQGSTFAFSLPGGPWPAS